MGGVTPVDEGAEGGGVGVVVVVGGVVVVVGGAVVVVGGAVVVVGGADVVVGGGAEVVVGGVAVVVGGGVDATVVVPAGAAAAATTVHVAVIVFTVPFFEAETVNECGPSFRPVYVFGFEHEALIPSRSQYVFHPLGATQLMVAVVEVVVPDGAETNASDPPSVVRLSLRRTRPASLRSPGRAAWSLV